MRPIIFQHLVLLAGAALIPSAQAQSQPAMKSGVSTRSVDAAVIFSVERTQIAQPNGDRFWLKGGGGNISFNLRRGLGIAADLNVEQGDSLISSFDKVSYMVGPRYTWRLLPDASTFMRSHSTRFYAESLVGAVHGFNSIFPSGTSGLSSSANAFSLFLGGGVDTTLHRGFGLRLIEAGFVHTNLPNNAADSQNDLRLGFGVSYHR